MNSSLDLFCGSEFWNLNQTWHTSDPDFTECAHQTILVWIPCAFILLFTPYEIIQILQSNGRDIPFSVINIAKLVINSILLFLSLVKAGHAALQRSNHDERYHYDVYVATPLLMAATFALTMALMLIGRKRGIRSSGSLFIFWFLLAIFGAFTFKSRFVSLLNKVRDDGEEFSYVVYYPLVVAMLFINCFADKEPTFTIDGAEKPKIPCPEEGASFLSIITYQWFDAMAWLGYKKPLEASDLWDLNSRDRSMIVVPKFNKHWEKTVKQNLAKPTETSVKFGADDEKVDVQITRGKNPVSILPALCKTFTPQLLMAVLLKVVHDLLSFVSPQILGLLINFVGNPEEENWKGYVYAIILTATAVLQTLFLGQYFQSMFVMGMQIKTALVSAIYRKAIRISNSARKESTVGDIVNLMSVDAQRFMDITTYLNMIWSSPLQIGLAMYFLYQILGASAFAGLGVMILLIPLNAVVANATKKLQITEMKNKDKRVKMMNEILSGIKILKLYAWEPSYQNNVESIRDKEIQVLRKSAFFNAGTTFLWTSAPFLVSCVSFMTFVWTGGVLTPEIAFVALTLFNIIRMPMNVLPMLIAQFVQASVSLKRINKFMNADELDPGSISHEPSSGNAVKMEDASFTWGSGEEPILKNINLEVERGKLIAVVGQVGAGKSSLISAMLGEMEKIGGIVNTQGQIAYVPQQAWIQNSTLRNNILFGKPYDSNNYSKIIDACALKPDLAILPGADETEIGEKGINLSGGQKQRVSLARAVYSNMDVYFLDDPLSAVDSHVGKHIFDKVIGQNGLLKDKTRVLVTHGITFLPQVDQIVVLKDGAISETGTYKELLDRKGAFADFLMQQLEGDNNDDGEAPDEELEGIRSQLENVLGKEEYHRKFSRQQSLLSDSQSQDNHEGELTTNESKISRSGSASSLLEKTNGIVRRRSSTKERSKSMDGGTGAPPAPKANKLIEAETSKTGKVKFGVYFHYLRSIGPLLSIITISLYVVSQGFGVYSNIWLAKWSKANASDDATRDLYLGVYSALGLGQAIFTLVGAVTMALGTLIASQYLHKLMLERILRCPMSFFDTTPIGRIVNRFAKDVDTVDNALPNTIRSALTCFLAVFAIIIVIGLSSPIFFVFVIPIGVLYYWIQHIYVATSRQLRRLESVSRSPIYSHFGETLTGASVIRAYGQQQRFIEESEARVDANQVCYYPSIIANRWLAIRLETIGNLVVLFASLFAVIGRDTMDPGLVGLSITYALNITQTLNWLMRMTSEIETNIVAVERIKEYCEVQQEAPAKNDKHEPPKDWPSKGRVSFSKYQVRYREGLDLVLKGISCDIEGGEKVGIVGRTGAGKSSLTLALFRIIESAGGSITIDGIDIAKLGLHTLRSRITIIPQDPVLFSGTLRMNLDPFDSYTDDEIWEALEHAHLKSFVKSLPAGLQHEVSEGGENLSVGQRQLICLARALLRKTKLLILDEATAAVDLQTDDLIQTTIRKEFKDCTVITIAHRLNTILDYNRVLVLDKGEIREFAPPNELLVNKQSIFYGMARDAGLV